MTPSGNVEAPVQQPSWFARNWKWLVPVGCVVPMLCCLSFVGVTYFGVTKMIEGSSVFAQAMKQANENPEVAASLGTPLKTGLGVTGAYQDNNGSGSADFSVPVEGPKGKGTLVVKAEGRRGTWTFKELTVDVGGKRIDLLEAAPVPDEEPADEPAPEKDE
jgi:hypothetical protein